MQPAPLCGATCTSLSKLHQKCTVLFRKNCFFSKMMISLETLIVFFQKKHLIVSHTKDDFGFDLIDFPTPKFLKTRQICIKTVAALSHVKFTHMDHT